MSGLELACLRLVTLAARNLSRRERVRRAAAEGGPLVDNVLMELGAGDRILFRLLIRTILGIT